MNRLDRRSEILCPKINECPKVIKMRTRLSVDFQNADEKGRVRLNTRGALRDIERLGLTLTNGMALPLTDGELETEGQAAYSEEEQIWVGMIDWSRLRDVKLAPP